MVHLSIISNKKNYNSFVQTITKNQFSHNKNENSTQIYTIRGALYSESEKEKNFCTTWFSAVWLFIRAHLSSANKHFLFFPVFHHARKYIKKKVKRKEFPSAFPLYHIFVLFISNLNSDLIVKISFLLSLF